MTSKKMSKEEFLKKQQIEAARKAGTMPAEVDAETGKDINPHIPQYMMQAPWYVDIGVPTLKHQRRDESSEVKESKEWYIRGAMAAPAATKYRKGACENCGSMTHKLKDCVERPRKVGAKFTEKDIKPDEYVQELTLGYDSKRDRYGGYDASEYMKTIEEWEKVEEKKKQTRARELQEKLLKGEQNGVSVEDEDKYAENADMAGQKVDLKTRTTVRNLRIREDTAKYLINLDLNSAFYEPKTRSMRENPNKDKEPTELSYAGENFERYTGDAKKFSSMQYFIHDFNEHGGAVTLQSDPTKAELLNKEVGEKKVELVTTQKKSILEKYGGEEHLQAPPKELLLAQNENYVEYSRTGKIIKGLQIRLARSKYEEDVFLNNHTSVWGSYWEDGRWGYKCCQQFVKNSYCTGEAGIEARKTAIKTNDEPKKVLPKETKESKETNSKSESDSKKRKLNSFDPHEQDKEYKEYMSSKSHFDDPMKSYVDTEL